MHCLLAITTVSWLQLFLGYLSEFVRLWQMLDFLQYKKIITTIIKVNSYRLARSESNECLGGKFSSY